MVLFIKVHMLLICILAVGGRPLAYEMNILTTRGFFTRLTTEPTPPSKLHPDYYNMNVSSIDKLDTDEKELKTSTSTKIHVVLARITAQPNPASTHSDYYNTTGSSVVELDADIKVSDFNASTSTEAGIHVQEVTRITDKPTTLLQNENQHDVTVENASRHDEVENSSSQENILGRPTQSVNNETLSTNNPIDFTSSNDDTDVISILSNSMVFIMVLAISIVAVRYRCRRVVYEVNDNVELPERVNVLSYFRKRGQ